MRQYIVIVEATVLVIDQEHLIYSESAYHRVLVRGAIWGHEVLSGH